MKSGREEERHRESVLKSYFDGILHGQNFTQWFSYDELTWIFESLSRKEEFENEHRDQWGNWEFPFTRENYSVPYLDNLVNSRMRERGLEKRSIWPGNKQFACWLTHDLDVISMNDPSVLRRRQRLAAARAGSLPARSLHSLHALYSLFRSVRKTQDDPLWLYERWIDAESEAGFTSTFFVFSRPEDKQDLHPYDCDYLWSDKIKYRSKLMSVGDFINSIASEGVEIGCHGSYFTWNNVPLLTEQKDKIEKLIGKEVVAARQHFLHFDIASTPTVLTKAGFKIDSTLGFNRTVGYRVGTAFPFLLNEKLLEVPQLIMDGALFLPNSLELDEAKACRKVEKIMDQVEETGGCLTVNFHPNYLLQPAWWNTYKFILKELKARDAAGVNAATIAGLYNRL